MGKITWRKFWRRQYGKECCNNERISVSTRWSKLPRYRTMFVIFAIEIWRSNHLSQHATSIIGYHIRQTFTTRLLFLEQMYAICVKEKPKKICNLRWRVNRFAENINEKALRKMVRHIKKRAALCIDSLGGHFEELL